MIGPQQIGTTIWLLAKSPLVGVIDRLIDASHDSGILSHVPREPIVNADIVQSIQPDDLLIIDANADTSILGCPDGELSYGGCWFANARRSTGHYGPIILLSIEAGTLSSELLQDDNVRVYVTFPNHSLFWFAPLYDVLLHIPAAIDQLPRYIEAALAYRHTRQRIVKQAISNTQSIELAARDALADHQWVGFEAVLRFLRGAQSEKAVHPDDAIDVIEHIAEQADSSSNGMSDHVRNKIRIELPRQRQRWENYRKTLCLDGGPLPRRVHECDKMVYRLLLIDDDHERLGWTKLLQAVLAGDGFEVLGCDFGEYDTFLADVAAPVDVILLDLSSKLANDKTNQVIGFETLATIRLSYRDIPVVLFTASEKMSLERQKQELGLAGYIVKSESGAQQDAGEYYRRLRHICVAAIDHRLRSLLLPITDNIKNILPSTHLQIKRRLGLAITEIDDALTSCHSSSLVFEAITVLPGVSLASSAERLFSYRGNGFVAWSQLGTLIRNGISHPNLGPESATVLDAEVMAILTLTALHCKATQSIAEREATIMSQALRLILLRSADRLENTSIKYADLSLKIGIKDKIDDVCETLRIAGMDAYNDASCQHAIESLGDLFKWSINRFAAVFNVTGLSLERTIFDLRQSFIHLQGREVYYPGYQHFGLVGFAYLHPNVVPVLNPEIPIPSTDGEHRCMLLLALTRVISWTIETGFAVPNPASITSLESQLTTNDPNSAFTPSGFTNRIDQQIHRFSGVCSACISEEAAAGIIQIGHSVLAMAAVDYLLEPHVASLQMEHQSTVQSEAKLRKGLSLAEADVKRTAEQLLDAETKHKSLVNDLRDTEDKLSSLYLKAQGHDISGLPKIRDLNSKIQQMPGDIEHLELLSIDLRDQHGRSRAALERAERNLKQEQAALLNQKFLLNSGLKLKEEAVDAPILVMRIVEAYASDNLIHLQIVQSALRTWVWTSERSELPRLLTDLVQLWKQRD